MAFRSTQIAPPRDWQRFEDLCHALFKSVWQNPYAQKNGRLGQAQNGVDVFGLIRGNSGLYQGVQCKGKDINFGKAPTVKEIKEELSKADRFSPKLAHWIFATTSSVDATLQKAAREISVDRAKQGKFGVDVLGWRELQALLAEAPEVIQEFYPEHAFDMPSILKKLEALPSRDQIHDLIALARRTVETKVSAEARWEQVDFGPARDLGPALMGRPLGPADAASCPRLAEADELVGLLKTAFSARLVAEPGAGKSVCAYQAALTLASEGMHVVRLDDPRAFCADLQSDSQEPTLFIVDDAHLMAPQVLNALEERARPSALLLSTHNTAEQQRLYRGAVVIDTHRAVEVIAKALRANRKETLRAVRKADDEIGDRMLNANLEQRLDEAERATYPWQFCFILGGGWRRAKQAASSARLANADVVLAVLAMHQLASRDAITSPQEIIDLCAAETIPAQTVTMAIQWLSEQRLTIAQDDCRSPHQRFSAVAMHEVLIGQTSEVRKQIFRIAEGIICDSRYPLAGLRNLVEELRFGRGNYRWTRALERTTIDRLVEQCWQAEEVDRLYTGLIIVQLDGFCDDWLEHIIKPYAANLVSWIESPGAAGFGISRIVNDLINHDKDYAMELVAASDASALADAFSCASPDEAYGISELVGRCGFDPTPRWKDKFGQSLDREKLLKVAREWTHVDDASRVSAICGSIGRFDEPLALEFVEAYLPTAQDMMLSDPVLGFRRMEDLFYDILRVFDRFGEAYTGKYRPSAHQRHLARSFCAKLDAKIVADQLSSLPLRAFQDAAIFMQFFRICAPRKAKGVTSRLDWEKISTTIGEEWSDLPHEAEVFLGTLYSVGASRDAISSFIDQNLGRIKNFPPRIAAIAPDAAISHAAKGGAIRLAQHGHVDWLFGPLVIGLFAEKRPDLLDGILMRQASEVAQALSGPNASFYSDAAPFLYMMRTYAPASMQKILRLIDATKASPGWEDCLAKRSEAREAAAILVDSALAADGELGELAAALRKHFPRASVPQETVPAFPPYRHRRKSIGKRKGRSRK